MAVTEPQGKPAFANYLDEFYRVLKPGGFLAFDAQIRESGSPFDPAPYLPWAEREYTVEELGRYSADHHFTWGAEQWAASVTPRNLNPDRGVAP